MAQYFIPQRFKHMSGTYTELYQRNRVLMAGEECFETHDENDVEHSPWKCKVGDGTTAWNDLEYQSTNAAPGSGGGDGAIGCTFDGNGAELVLDVSGDILVPYDCTIVSATLLADQSGNLEIGVWSDAYANYPPSSADAITGAAPPTLSGANKSQDTTLTGWSTALTAGTTIRFSIVSVDTITRATIILKVTRT